MATTQKKETALTVPVPEGFHSGIDPNDMTLPSIILWQAMTDVEELDGEPGDFVNSVTKENYGTEFSAFIVDTYKSARMYGGEDNREIIKFSRDAKNWDTGEPIPESAFRFIGDNPPAASILFHYIVMIEGEEIPALVTFKGASIRHGKNLNSLLNITRPYWKHSFVFSSFEKRNEMGKFFVLQATRGSKAPSPKMIKLCAELYTVNQQTRFKSYETDTVVEEKAEDEGDGEIPF